MASPMPTITLPSGDQIPVLGQGAWHLGEIPGRRDSEVAALRRGLDLGMNLIDTAEMYGNGDAEILVGEAIVGRRDEVFLVSKVLPHHASREGTARACQDSLRRLDTDRLDLYLLHWRGRIPLAETVEAFLGLQAGGLIRNWGVSNFDVPDMQELMSLPGGPDVATDQVLYNLAGRAPEFDLFPSCRELNAPPAAGDAVAASSHRGNETAVLLRQLDRDVEPFLRGNCLGERRENGPDMLEYHLEEGHLVRVGALPPGDPPQELLQRHPLGTRRGRLGQPQRRVQQRIELDDQILHLTGGDSLGQRLQRRLGGALRRLPADPAPPAGLPR